MSNNGHSSFVPTDQQRRAIEHVHGPMLVVAGAGTGKTTVLSRRIAHLIESKAAKPQEILAVTYTRNGAAELLARAGSLLYPGLEPHSASLKLLSSGLQANTFHGYCFSLLCQAGLKFALVDEQDLYVLLRRRLSELQLEHFIKAGDPGRFLKDLKDFFRRCQDELRTPDDYDAYVAQIERNEIPLQRVARSKDAETMPREEVLARCREIARTFRHVEELLKEEGLGTFGHIITRAVELLSRQPSVLKSAQQRARFILIDEFQDSNVAQIQLAKFLAGEEANVFAVGDPDQAIYRFRGATSGAFDQFLRTFSPERIARVTMSDNRRSTPAILACAYEAIRCNPEVGSVLLQGGGWPRQPLSCARQEREKNLAKARPVQAVVHNKNEEAAFIADSIEEAIRRQRPARRYRDFAVLYRNHWHRKEVVDELRCRGIPVQVKGADLFDAPEVRDAMAVLRVLDGPDPVALVRVAALPRFSVDPERFRAELALAGRNPPVEAVLCNVPGGAEVMAVVRQARHELADANGMLPAAIRIMREPFQIGDNFPLQRLQEFAGDWSNKPKPITRQGTLQEFLEYVDFFREGDGTLSEDITDDDPVAALAPRDIIDEPEDAVQLMTVHAAKGLEFPCVFLIRVTSNMFPSAYKQALVEFPQELRREAAVEDDSRTLHAEEERRLFYVALTRARDELYLCGPFARGKDQTPSGYMRELLHKKNTALRGALECRMLPQATLIGRTHAAAGPLPLISQWMQLPPRPDGRLSELSASAVEQYERCPLSYKLKRDWHIPEEPAAQMQFGSAMHLAIKAYFDGVRVEQPPDQETVIACFLDEFSKTKIEEDVQRDLYEKLGRQQLTRFLRSELAKPGGEVLETEHSSSFKVNDITVRAKMDRVDRAVDDKNNVVIVDYKTGRPRTQEDADKSLQLSVYALAAKSKGLTPSSLVFINLENCTAAASSRSADELKRAETKVIEVAAKIAAGEFDPDPGPVCKGCSYHSICPAHEGRAYVSAASAAARN